MNDAYIKDALLKGNYVSAEDIKKADEYSITHHVGITEYLFNQELLNKDLLGQAIAESVDANYYDLHSNVPPKSLMLKIPKDFAVKHRVVLVEENQNSIVIVTDSVKAPELGKDIQGLFPKKEIIAEYSLPEDIDHVLSLYKEKLETRFSKIIEQQNKVAPEIVEQIIEDAISLSSSDIHLEPQETEVVVRFRIDGVLEEAGILPKQYYENILNRIKIESRLRIDEHNRSQDGAIRYHKNGISADLRVSIIPTLTGEKVVMRILGEYLRTLNLSEIGLTPEYQKRLTEMAERPYGMILATGPTGSGKTTTLYSILRMLNESGVNITTIEDPVEYRIPRVNQVQVNEQSNLTFANGLRTIVRQDPDIILVGEIRDLETAEIAVNASLTGHLLLSSFHANDAATVIPRLLDMKVEPFLLASTLMIIVAQRLVRRICPLCKVSETVESAELIKKYPKLAPFISKKTIQTYRGKGCAQCNGTGYKGQVGIFEFIEITQEIEELILQHPSSEQIWQVARSQGTKSLFENGLEKVDEGLTTYQELLRVALPPSDAATLTKKK